LQARVQAIADILANPESYETGQQLKDAVTAERNRFDTFDLAFQLEEWAVGGLLGRPAKPPCKPDPRPGQLPAGFPSNLKTAFEKRLEDQGQVLRTSLEDAKIQAAGDQCKQIGKEIVKAIQTYGQVQVELDLLRRRLRYWMVRRELQGDERKSYAARLDAQEALLEDAGDQAGLDAVSEALGQITTDLQALYQQWRRFYYDDDTQTAVRTQADAWIAAINARPSPGLGWPEMSSRIQHMESRADKLVAGETNYQLASNLFYFRWRIAWFYHDAVPWAEAELAKVTDAGKKASAQKVLRTQIEWLLNMTYQDETASSFDKLFLDQHLEPLYTAIGQARAPDLVQGPPAEIPPQPPQYRPLPDLKKKGVPEPPKPFKPVAVPRAVRIPGLLGGDGLAREIRSLSEWFMALPLEIYKFVK
jgi:hypothetical protein